MQFQGWVFYNLDCKEYEPLGQEIQPIEPIDPPISLTNETGRYSASDAEWLCRYPDKEESMMPIACQKAANESLEWWFEIKESSPQKIPNTIDAPLPDYIQPYSPSDEMLSYALASSSKKDKDKKGKTIKGGHLATVQSEKAKDSMIDMSEIPGADASQTDKDKLKPRVKGDITVEQSQRLNESFNLVLELLENEKCANIFGGQKKALKALKKTNFSFADLGKIEIGEGENVSPQGSVTYAITKGKNVVININGIFMANDKKIPAQIGNPVSAYVSTTLGHNAAFDSDVKYAVFTILHELGHRAKTFGKDDKDGVDDKNGTVAEKQARNNTKIIEGCFVK